MKNNILYLLIVSILVILSFAIYAPINYIFLNSDQGVHALMAVNFDWKNCTYYWGQNRLGSILPLLAYLLVKINIDPLWAVSIIQYFFLVGTIFLFNKLIDNIILKITFAIFLLFPLVSFIEILNVGHPYAPQFFLLLLLIFLTRKINNNFSFSNILLILLFWIISMLSIWVSELSYISVTILVGFMFTHLTKHHRFTQKTKILIKSPFFYSSFIAGIGIWKIQKTLKTIFSDLKYESYGINPYHQVIKAFKIHIDRFVNSVTFLDGDLFINIFTTSIFLLIVIISIIGIRKIDKDFILKIVCYKYYTILFLIGISTFCAINFSEWASIEQYPRRYYVFSYFCFLSGLVSLINDSFLKYKKGLFVWTLLVTSIIGSLSFINLNKEKDKFRLGEHSKQQILALKKVTFIGDYWYTYVMAAYNANNIIAIVPQQNHLRNKHQIESAFSNKTIYLIKNDWLENFPITIVQYDRRLIKDNSDDVMIGNAILHKYINYSIIPEIERINEIKKQIIADKNWMKLMVEKARARNISIEDMINTDAKYTYNTTHVKTPLEEKLIEIKSNKNWMKLIREKAKEQNISIEEAIYRDAEYCLKSKK